jgi:hypothetical protein
MGYKVAERSRIARNPITRPSRKPPQSFEKPAYSPNCLVKAFCELRLLGFLRSSRQTADGGTMHPVERLARHGKAGPKGASHEHEPSGWIPAHSRPRARRFCRWFELDWRDRAVAGTGTTAYGTRKSTTWHRNRLRLPSAHSGDLLGNGEMVFVITAEDPANPLGELVSTEQPL